MPCGCWTPASLHLVGRQRRTGISNQLVCPDPSRTWSLLAYQQFWPAQTNEAQRKNCGKSMNRAEEGALAWALAESATRFLRPGARAWICAKIGAGEQESAIRDLLSLYANSDAELPCELAAPIQAWIRGYVGSDSEPLLRHLYDQITVSAA